MEMIGQIPLPDIILTTTAPSFPKALSFITNQPKTHLLLLGDRLRLYKKKRERTLVGALQL